MPAKSPEAVARKNARLREKRAAKRKALVASFKRQVSKTSPEYRRQFVAPLDMTKGELRALIAQAVQNTAELSA